MRLYIEFAIRWLFLFILSLQASLTTSDDMCSSITRSSSSDGNGLSLTIITDFNRMPRGCSCKMTGPVTLECSFYTCSLCAEDNIRPQCTELILVELCPCFMDYSLTFSPTCISTSITSSNCPTVTNETQSCPIPRKSSLSFSTDPVTYSCQAQPEKNNKGFEITIQHITIEDVDEPSDHKFTKGQCDAIITTPNASNTTPPQTTSIYSSVATTAKIGNQSSFESTPKPETTGKPTLTHASKSMIMNMSTDSLQNLSMMSYDSEKDIGIRVGVGVGVGLGGGILLIIVIIIVILIFRRRRAESHKLHANDTTQSTAAADPSESSYESYRVPVAVPYDNATNGVTASGYQTITYDNEPVGESNDGYTEIKEPEGTSDHNGYDECRIGRNEVYSMYHKTGNELDKVSENPSMNIENETTVIDNDLYG